MLKESRKFRKNDALPRLLLSERCLYETYPQVVSLASEASMLKEHILAVRGELKDLMELADGVDMTVGVPPAPEFAFVLSSGWPHQSMHRPFKLLECCQPHGSSS